MAGNTAEGEPGGEPCLVGEWSNSGTLRNEVRFDDDDRVAACDVPLLLRLSGLLLANWPVIVTE